MRAITEYEDGPSYLRRPKFGANELSWAQSPFIGGHGILRSVWLAGYHLLRIDFNDCIIPAGPAMATLAQLPLDRQSIPSPFLVPWLARWHLVQPSREPLGTTGSLPSGLCTCSDYLRPNLLALSSDSKG